MPQVIASAKRRGNTLTAPVDLANLAANMTTKTLQMNNNVTDPSSPDFTPGQQSKRTRDHLSPGDKPRKFFKEEYDTECSDESDLMNLIWVFLP